MISTREQNHEVRMWEKRTLMVRITQCRAYVALQA
jgi:hypothetical protein